ncbi:glucan endo-1,3-beta-glucosidase 10-like [Wolffia australiana]
MAASPAFFFFFVLFFFFLLGLLEEAAGSSLGVNYGLLGDNLPQPAAAVPLLRSIGASRVKIYDADPAILQAFAGTGFELVVGLADECVVRVSDPSQARAWVRTNIAPFVPRTKISAITVGNEVLTGNKSDVIRCLVPAMEAVHAALTEAGLDGQIRVTTPHSLAVLGASFPPSSGAFRKDLVQPMCQVIAFLRRTGAPLLVNAYPYFAYEDEPREVTLEYALFEKDDGVVDAGTGMTYKNMLHAQVDAVYAAVDRAVGRGNGLEVQVSETGWPSKGDPTEPGATVENARKYNVNLARLVGKNRGTPLRPDVALHVYVFALFNENLKPGPTSERNYGLFKPDGSPVYDLGIKSSSSNVTPPSGGNGTSSSGGGGSGGPTGWSNNNPEGIYQFSSSAVAAAVGGARWLLLLICGGVAFPL